MNPVLDIFHSVIFELFLDFLEATQPRARGEVREKQGRVVVEGVARDPEGIVRAQEPPREG